MTSQLLARSRCAPASFRAATFLLLLFAGSVAGTAQTVDVTVTVAAEPSGPISPLIYGINAYVYDVEWGGGPWKTGLANHASGLNVPFRRLGGNTMTSYNWESGWSNSGADDSHSNNGFQSYITGAGDAPWAPGAALTTFHDHSLQTGAASLLQLPMAGYVAADGDGPVSQADAAPSDRWKEVRFAKQAPLSETPDLNDGAVYVDEEMHFLLERYGNARSERGILAYELDNEPGLWHHTPNTGAPELRGTHSRLFARPTRCSDIIDRSVALATTIRRMDSTAEIFGPAMWGYLEMYSLWLTDNANEGGQPADWMDFEREPFLTHETGDPFRYNRMTWAAAWLDAMWQASRAADRRLLDVFSVHYYPDAEAVATDALRMQAPRSLWDPSYVEPSWITKVGNGFTDGHSIELIPKLEQAITDFYPGTRLAITEYNFGGRHTIAGAVAQADALGIFGAQGLYAANHFGTVDDYIAAAFRIYRNYDGMMSTFGDSSVAATSSDIASLASYASVDSSGRLHLILINREVTREVRASVRINGRRQGNARVWGIRSGSSDIVRLPEVTVAAGPSPWWTTFSTELPAMSVTLLVLDPPSTTGIGAGVEESTLRLSLVPNVTSRTTSVELVMPRRDHVTVRLLDQLGQVVRIVHEGDTPPDFSVALDVDGLATGSYVVEAVRGDTRRREKLVVVR